MKITVNMEALVELLHFLRTASSKQIARLREDANVIGNPIHALQHDLHAVMGEAVPTEPTDEEIEREWLFAGGMLADDDFIMPVENYRTFRRWLHNEP